MRRWILDKIRPFGTASPPFLQSTQEGLLLRRRDAPDGAEQLAAFGDVNLHLLRLPHQVKARGLFEFLVRRVGENRPHSLKAVPMLVLETPDDFLAQQIGENGIKIQLLKGDMRTGLELERFRRLLRGGDIVGAQGNRKVMKAAPQLHMIVAKRVNQGCKMLCHFLSSQIPPGAVLNMGESRTPRRADTLQVALNQADEGAMCRLYGFMSNEPAKVECTLVYAQNALMVQSREDIAGRSHADGWGLATYENNHPRIERQAWAAYHGEHFRRAAERIYSCNIIAHVRRATVGPPLIDNTHPFWHGRFAFAHNGTVTGFDVVRQRLRRAMTESHRAAIRGSTDSEHVFRYLLSQHERHSGRPLLETLRAVVEKLLEWCKEAGPSSELGLNLMLSDGDQLVGSRVGRSLSYVERDGVYDCEVCGFPHIHHDPAREFRAVVVASEPITHESWHSVPDYSLFRIAPRIALEIEPL